MDELFPKGTYRVRFMNETVQVIKIERYWMDTYGTPTFVVSDDGTMYNFKNILSIKLQEASNAG